MNTLSLMADLTEEENWVSIPGGITSRREMWKYSSVPTWAMVLRFPISIRISWLKRKYLCLFIRLLFILLITCEYGKKN